MKAYHGARARRSYFEGWYLKQQAGSDTVALIPAIHRDEAGRASASLQVITGAESFALPYAGEAFQAHPSRFAVRLGPNVFSETGCILDASSGPATVTGRLTYGPFLPPRSDIMGPFRFVPHMQCRHSVLSLFHTVRGALWINGRYYRFDGGPGYAEGDRGRSFPRRYIWTQGSWAGNCAMLSVAEIPYGLLRFTGCICSVLLNGREHRLATYLGARPERISGEAVTVAQGRLRLEAELLDGAPQPLRAPRSGAMSRTIHESAACRVRYRLTDGDRVLLDLTCPRASFENEW